MPRSTSLPVEERAVSRRFTDAEVVAYLDALTLEAVCGLIGEPGVRTAYADGCGYWRPGDGRPALADDDPAVMQAIGRCAAHRARASLPTRLPALLAAHPRPCEWCEYPAEELLRACDWASWQSRYAVSEILEWANQDGVVYTRSGPTGWYGNPAHRRFWDLPASRREQLVRAAQYPTEAAA